MGLDYCHRMGVVNRDIKLENTLLDESPKPLVKITDFGYCKASNDSLPKSKVGTPGYTGVVPIFCLCQVRGVGSSCTKLIMGRPQGLPLQGPGGKF